MICPKCEASGGRSRVYVTPGGISTAMAYQPYYDEEGRYHYHDGNSFTQTWACSEGHSGAIVGANRCWCGWVGREERIRVNP